MVVFALQGEVIIAIYKVPVQPSFGSTFMKKLCIDRIFGEGSAKWFSILEIFRGKGVKDMLKKNSQNPNLWPYVMRMLRLNSRSNHLLQCRFKCKFKILLCIPSICYITACKTKTSIAGASFKKIKSAAMFVTL